MFKYTIKRIISMIVTLFFISILTFVLMHSIPGGPFTSERRLPPKVEKAINEKYGLDDPLYLQYFNYMKDVVTKGDFGISYKKAGLSVNTMLKEGFPYSGIIGLGATAIIILFGIPFGIIAALKQNKFTDRFLMVLSTLGVTIPSFVLATGFLYFFSKKLGWVPSFGVSDWKGFIGPIVTIGGFSMAFVTRLTRSSMLEVLSSDYIKTARAKGLSEFTVITKHAMRNAMIPVITYLGPMIAGILTGSFVIEKVFAVPGIGNLFVTFITSRDYTVIMGITIFYAIFLVVAVFIVDILYAMIDPRIKFDE
ncbi:MAG: peptide ABC transporter permease [Firmicutes bacterium HGW-Firmicutes-7]|nr:MAG: peptide ABC transporter permease [Firmicutes bacterium HGW-Firmicutes-7]